MDKRGSEFYLCGLSHDDEISHNNITIFSHNYLKIEYHNFLTQYCKLCEDFPWGVGGNRWILLGAISKLLIVCGFSSYLKHVHEGREHRRRS